LGPSKVMKNRFSSATTLSRSATLPFVISTEAKRSGEISVWMLLLGNVFRQSKAQWRDLRFFPRYSIKELCYASHRLVAMMLRMATGIRNFQPKPISWS
jgi:hypothetical protein